MKIINPFNLLMYVAIYLVTWHYFRFSPTTKNGRVGWCSEEGEHAIAYSPMTSTVRFISLQVDGRVVEGVATPDGSIRGWLGTVGVYRSLLHVVVGDYLDYPYEVEEDADGE